MGTPSLRLIFPEKPLITFTEPGRILRWDGKKLDTLFVSDDISGGDGIASGYESGKVVLITSDGKHTVLFENLRTPAGIGFYIPLLEEGKVLEKRIR
jgi:hypothetical protein